MAFTPNERAARYYEKNAEDVKAAMRRRADEVQADPERKAKLNARRRVWREQNRKREAGNVSAWQKAKPLNYMLNTARRRAKDRGLEFTVTKDDFPSQLPTHCPVLGIELRYGGGKARDGASASIDRVDSALGYVPGNVQVISWRANDLKGDATLEELQAVVAHMSQKAKSRSF